MMDDTKNIPEQDPSPTEKAKKVVGEAREKLAPVAEQAQAKVTELKTTKVDQDMRDLLQIVSTFALVGILLYNRKTFKFTKRVIKNMDKNMVSTQETISALKAAGQQFTFYPGIGVYVD